MSPSNPATGSQVHTAGRVMGGQQPIAGATIQLYSVGTGGDGSAATPLLTQGVTTGADGSFSLTGLYPCVPGTLVYLVATQGSPTLTAGGTPSGSNPNLALLAVLGTCDSLSSSSFIVLNEVTTVAGVSALAPFMTSFSAVGSAGSDVGTLQADFALAAEFANSSTGMSPGTNVPSGYSVPSAEIYTLANILATCVNSYGGVSGDGTGCGTLFALTTPQGTAPPANTIQAMLEIALYPTLNTPTLYMLPPPTSPFYPALTETPPNFTVALTASSSLQISPSGLGFPAEVVGGSGSPNETVTLTNTGTASITIYSLGTTGANPSDFSLGSCPATLTASASCNLGVSFAPTGYGTRSASIAISSSAASGSVYVPLTGVGINSSGTLFATPSSLTFYKSEVGVAETPQTVQLINAGSTAVTLGAMSFGGAGTDFSEGNSCPAELPAGGACTVSVGLTPSTTALQSASLLVTNSSVTNPLSVALTENAVGSAGPIAFSSSYVDFNNFETESVNLVNSGSVSVLISSIMITPGFTQTNNCGASLAAGASCTFNMTPNETLVGPFLGNLIVSDNAASSPQVVPLTSFLGNTDENIIAAFGEAAVGTVSPYTFTGIVDATSNYVSPTFTLGGPNAGDFSVSFSPSPCLIFNNNPFTVCDVIFQFHAGGVGPRAGTVTFNGGHSPPFAFTGTGVTASGGPLVSFVPTGGANPSIPLAVAQSTVGGDVGYPYNIGSTVLNLTGSPVVTFTGPNASEFSLLSSGTTCGGTIVIGAKCQLTYAFAPLATGIRNATMNFTDGVSGTTLQIPISELASAPAPTVSPSSYVFPPTHIGQNSTKIFTATGATGDTLYETTSGPFSVNPGSCPGEGGGCSFTVTYSPTSSSSPGNTNNTATNTGTLTVQDYTGATDINYVLTYPTTKVAISGTPGIASPSLSTSALNFGPVPVGNLTGTQAVTINNIGDGYMVLNFSSGATGIYGPNPATTVSPDFPYSYSGPTYVPIAPGGSYTFNIAFEPTATGVRDATLQIYTSVSATPYSVVLHGTGQ